MKFHPEKCGDADRYQQPYEVGYKLLSARTNSKSRVNEQVPLSQYQRRPNLQRPHRKDNTQSK